MRHICIETGSANELQIVSQQYLETKDNAGKFVFTLRVILFYEKQEKYQRFPAKKYQSNLTNILKPAEWLKVIYLDQLFYKNHFNFK